MVGELDLLKTLGGTGALGAFVISAYFVIKAFGNYLDKQQAASEKKDALFAATLKDNTSEMRSALSAAVSDMKAGLSEVKVGMESMGRSIVDIDKSHTQQSRETFLQLIQLNDKQNGAISTMVQKVEHLDQTVVRMSETLEDHGRKLDNLTRSLPPPEPGESPGSPPGGEFRPARG